MHRDMLEFLIKQLTVFASLIYPSNCKKNTELLKHFCLLSVRDTMRICLVSDVSIATASKLYTTLHTRIVCAHATNLHNM